MGRRTELEVVTEDAPACVHHWVLGDPSEGAIPARCKRCGGERVFAARVEGVDRSEDDRDLVASSGAESSPNHADLS